MSVQGVATPLERVAPPGKFCGDTHEEGHVVQINLFLKPLLREGLTPSGNGVNPL